MQILHFNFKKIVKEMLSVAVFTTNLSITIKRLTRYNQVVVLAAMLEGKAVPSNMAANTNPTTLLS